VSTISREVCINGLSQVVQVDLPLIYQVLLPAIRQVADDAREKGERAYIFLAAPPGTGKSVLAELLQQEAASEQLELDVVGLDGFHRSNQYLATHTINQGDGPVPLAQVKGAPETFDLGQLKRYLEQGRHQALAWPVYNRVTHEPETPAKQVTAPVVIVEGNYLLLNEPGWGNLADHAALCMFITATPELLKERLVVRKQQGGLDRATAEEFVARSDLVNVNRVLENSMVNRAQILLELKPDGQLIVTKQTH